LWKRICWTLRAQYRVTQEVARQENARNGDTASC
jgi:hypothetical protein